MYYIYRIKNLINNKTYIGQRKLPEKYTYETDPYMGSGTLIIRAQNKYGIKKFTKEILATSPTQKTIDFLEKAFIASERDIRGTENCYNIRDGGQGGSDNCEKQDEKISKSPEVYKTPENEEIEKRIAYMSKQINSLKKEQKMIQKIKEIREERQKNNFFPKIIKETEVVPKISEEIKYHDMQELCESVLKDYVINHIVFDKIYTITSLRKEIEDYNKIKIDKKMFLECFKKECKDCCKIIRNRFREEKNKNSTSFLFISQFLPDKL